MGSRALTLTCPVLPKSSILLLYFRHSLLAMFWICDLGFRAEHADDLLFFFELVAADLLGLH